MAIPFTNVAPPTARKIFRVEDATSQLTAFNEVYRQFYDQLETAGLGDDNNIAKWRSAFREGIVWVGGKPSEIDFFREMMGGTYKQIDATDYYIQYDDAPNFNLFATADVTGTSGTVTGAYYEQLVNGSYTGPYATFQPIAEMYANDGTLNNVFVGMGLFNLRDGKELTVIKLDKTTPYAWNITVAPLDGTYIPNIYVREAMPIRPSTLTTGYDSTVSVQVNTPWMTTGYIDKIQPIEQDRKWETPFNNDMGYQDVLQFAILFDNVSNKEVPTWYTKAALEARNDVIMGTTAKFFVGERNTNAGLTVNNYTQQFNGFDGFLPKMFYGGGNVYPYNTTYGFTLNGDFMNIVFANDALKKSTEWLMLDSLKFQWNFETGNSEMFKNNAGACTFDTFTRMEGDYINRLQIKSYAWANNTIHTKVVGAWSDARYFGNSYIQNMAIIMPGYGMTDSKGNPVGPVEYYMSQGNMMSSEWTETMGNGRQTAEQSSKYFGTVHRRNQMAVHGVQNMYVVLPTDYV